MESGSRAGTGGEVVTPIMIVCHFMGLFLGCICFSMAVRSIENKPGGFEECILAFLAIFICINAYILWTFQWPK